MNKIYVVIGCTGEYSDQREWPVCAYTNREMADKHADLAMEWAHKNEQQFRDSIKQVYDKWFQYKQSNTSDNDFNTFYTNNTIKSPYDPNMNMDYTGTDYFVLEVEMREVIP